jgi:hypothetical protein
MVSHALFHPWPGATLEPKPADPRSAAKALRLRERRLMEYLTRRRSQRWMTEEAAAAQRHPNLLEDNPSSG